MMVAQLINHKTLLGIVPFCKRTILDMEKRGEFPRRIALTSRYVVWDAAEVQAWIEGRKQSGSQADRPGFKQQTA